MVYMVLHACFVYTQGVSVVAYQVFGRFAVAWLAVKGIIYAIAVIIGVTIVTLTILVQVALGGIGNQGTVVLCIPYAVVIIIPIAGITLSVPIGVELVRVGYSWAVVHVIIHPIVVAIGNGVAGVQQHRNIAEGFVSRS